MSSYMYPERVSTVQPYRAVHYFYVTVIYASSQTRTGNAAEKHWKNSSLAVVCAYGQSRILDAADCYCTLLVGWNWQCKIVQPDTHVECSHMNSTTYKYIPVYSTLYLLHIYAAAWDCIRYVQMLAFALARLWNLTRGCQARQTSVDVYENIRMCVKYITETMCYSDPAKYRWKFILMHS